MYLLNVQTACNVRVERPDDDAIGSVPAIFGGVKHDSDPNPGERAPEKPVIGRNLDATKKREITNPTRTREPEKPRNRDPLATRDTRHTQTPILLSSSSSVIVSLSPHPTMTIKETKSSGQTGTGEPDIVFSSDQAAAGEPDIVFSADQNPSSSATAAAGNSHNEPDIPIVMATLLPEIKTAKPEVVDATSSGTGTQYNTTSPTHPSASAPPVVVQQMHQHPTHGQGTPIPEGARWITVKHPGGVTWTLCAIISTVTCCIVFCPCGLWALLCPCDQIRAYEVNGQVYDEHGRPLGHISKLRIA
jgi:hypothetical protein